jgi:hypothetical protein
MSMFPLMMRLRLKLEAIATVPLDVTLPVSVDVPATVRLLPTATLPLASLTMLFTALEGWTTLMDLRVLMVASY